MPAGRDTHRGWLQEGVIRGSMLSKTMLPGDAELGKKDDDHQPRDTLRMSDWTFLKTPLRWRRRRILLAVVGLYLVYLFIHNIPDLGELHGRHGPNGRQFAPTTADEHGDAYDREPSGPPPGTRPHRRGETAPHTYAGQIKFYRLAVSLRNAANVNGYRSTNRHVLFAVSSLKSASTLLPLVCEMSRWSRNWVNVAFMGREDIPLDDLLEINGIDKVKCPAVWHDARPDYTEYSTDERAQSSVIAAMSHINTFLRPQVAIVDDELLEDPSFTRGMRVKTEALGMPLIEVPKDRAEDFLWMTRLDSGSLKNWNQPTVDILIQVPPRSSSVLHVLKSIKNADYAGVRYPRLTIELPAEVDISVKRYLEKFSWPPNAGTAHGASQLTIRRRIANQRATQEDSAIRFLELFFPTSTTHSHVLLLSPQAQLSRQYYHYLLYVLLEYKYSSYTEDDVANVMGLSLEVPSVLLNGQTKLTPPTPADMHTPRYQELFPRASNAPFLWQAPNSHATLFFGDKWAELHSFLSNRVKKHFKSAKGSTRAKIVSETLPSWTEYMLELMRARGYSVYYPATSASDAFVTIHNELYHAPEEFVPQPSAHADTGPLPKLTDEPFLRAEEPPPPPKNPEPPVIPSSKPLHLALPFEGDLPEIPHLPYLLYDGTMVPLEKVSTIASAYANEFRESVGSCTIPEGKHRKVEVGDTKDLFCFGDEDEDDWEDDNGVVDDPIEEDASPIALLEEPTAMDELPTRAATAAAAETTPATAPGESGEEE
ncbi:hypothetical protein BDV95DRAFT_571818 [Massariosphaeria phaeospora]|uniref:Glycosyltransferase 2 n=1 Tax=Massariosphaeria phaeospora TaxID=100035 RepID=A0A7C8M5Q8_9PLEO|nr:hypothetical protein BDV95DRAFT_571818 [Massariosphaeria phaeospora]